MKNVKFEIGESMRGLSTRPVRGSLTDYLVVPAKGLEPEGVLLCWNHLYFPDGTQKTDAHTNMSLDGMLGYPYEFDLSFIDVHVAKFSDPKDVLAVLRSLSFELIFGGNSRFAAFAGSDMKPYFHLDLEINKEQEEKPTHERFEEARRYFESILDQHVDRGGFWRWFRIDVRTSTNTPRRINSVEMFRLSVKQSPLEKPLSGEVHLKALLTGVKYCPV
jgi:hypothetical protein